MTKKAKKTKKDKKIKRIYATTNVDTDPEKKRTSDIPYLNRRNIPASFARLIECLRCDLDPQIIEEIED
ncbi:MAG: hypothetical protein HDS09_02135 [Bacteroides sp.]|nr:hypothetical protein [Bacteroides sp.]